jgi:hypothetical protein
MWTAEIKQVSRSSANPLCVVQVSILFDDGSDRRHTINENFSNTSSDALKTYCRQRIAQLEAIDAFVSAPPLGPLDLEVKKPEPVEPTEEQIAAQKYAQEKQALIQAKQELDLGLLTEEEFAAQLELVKTSKAAVAIVTTAEAIK